MSYTLYPTVHLALDSAEGVVVASRTDLGIVVMNLTPDRTTWGRLGDALGGESAIPRGLLRDKDGALIVSYVDGNRNGRIQRWSGTRWDDLGGVATPPGSLGDYGEFGRGPAIALTSNGRLFTAYANPTREARLTYAKVRVRSFADGMWSPTGDASDEEPHGFFTVKIAVNRSGVPSVLFFGDPGVRVRTQAVDNSWPPGPVVDPANEKASQGADLVVDDAGRPLVFACFAQTHRIRRFENGAWGNLGPAMPEMCESDSTHLAKGENGEIFAFWHSKNDSLHVAEVSGDSWRELAGPSGAAPGEAGAIKVDSKGRPVLAWIELATKSIHVAQLNR